MKMLLQIQINGTCQCIKSLKDSYKNIRHNIIYLAQSTK